MDATTMTTSRRKVALYLAGSLTFAGVAAWALQHSESGAWKLQAAIAFFGLCALVFAWRLVRPQRLLLDREGFTLLGGLARSPRKVAWRDLDGFFVYRLSRGTKMIGYNYRPGAREVPRLARFSRPFGADGALPMGWKQSPEAMVAQLNAYRAGALAESTGGNG
jgi:hypothetical protein